MTTWVQPPMFPTVGSPYTLPNLVELPSWRTAARVCVDVETRDPDLGRDKDSRNLGPGVRRDPRTNYVVGIGFAIEDGPAYYLPVRHATGENLPESAVWKYLQNAAADFRGILVGAGLDYDLDWLARYGVEFSGASWIRDVFVTAPILDELQMRYSLDAIAKRADLPGKDEARLRAAAANWNVNPKRGLWILPPCDVEPYALYDVRTPLAILRKHERAIEDEDLNQIYDLESRLLPILVRMTRRGVALDMDRVGELDRWAAGRETEALQELERETGVRLRPAGALDGEDSGDVWKADMCARALTSAGVIVHRTPKTGQPSVTDALLSKNVDVPAATALLRARKANKLRTTFAKSFLAHQVNGRLHCTFNQMKRDSEDGDLRGARTARLSAEHPNLQQQPGERDPEAGKMIRRCFVPDEGKLWASVDYSQQEPRLAVHYAYRSGCRGAEEAVRRYRDNPNTDFHTFMAEITGLRRRLAKDVFLGSIYGMGGAKLCKFYLNLPTKMIWSERMRKEIEVAGEEGQEIRDKFNTGAPWAREISDKVSNVVKTRGYVVTLGGRKLRFPSRPDGTFDWVHKGLNTLIQGSAGVQTKMAMVAAEAAGFELQLQEHDELDASVNSREHGEELARLMENVVKLEVPVVAHAKVGTSWGEAE